VIADVPLSLAPTLVLNPDVRVSATRTRRRFTAAYKRQILDAAAACTRPGEIGALLRREGLYSSHLTAWRAAARQGNALTPRRGPAPTAPNPLAPRVAELERALAQATRRADRADLIVDAPKKFSQLIGLTLPPLDASREPR
jgi:transposase-like protein